MIRYTPVKESAFGCPLQKRLQNAQPQNEFCVQWGLGRSPQQAKKVSVYEHSHCLRQSAYIVECQIESPRIYAENLSSKAVNGKITIIIKAMERKV